MLYANGTSRLFNRTKGDMREFRKTLIVERDFPTETQSFANYWRSLHREIVKSPNSSQNYLATLIVAQGEYFTFYRVILEAENIQK